MNQETEQVRTSGQYLRNDTAQSFLALEGLIADGYSVYVNVNNEIANGKYRDQKNNPPEELMKKWGRQHIEWTDRVINDLCNIFVTTNYANEFAVANIAGGFAVSTGAIQNLRINLLGHIRKLESYRDRLLEKSSLTINNLGYFNVQVGNDNSNEQRT